MVQFVKEQFLDYDSFVTFISIKVSELMGDYYSVKTCKVIKNNSLELDSLVILKKGGCYTPNIYLNPYYEDYLNGFRIEEIVDRIYHTYQNFHIPRVEKEFHYSFEEMKPFIIYRLINYKKNCKLLSSIPHIKYLDLAITFHCLVRNDEEGIGTIRITNEHMKAWNIKSNDIEKLAINNTPKFFPASIRNMKEVIKDLLSEEISKEKDTFSNEDITATRRGLESRNDFSMFILSNLKGINGASCILYKDVLSVFAEKINSDYYIIPSSIHEVILIPADDRMNKESLNEMVREVNQSQVAPEEVLSDRVYYFSKDLNSIIL